MHYFPEQMLEKLKIILSCENIMVLSCQSGGNSVVYCVEADKKKYAVKSYPPFAPDQRDRLAAELMAYQFFNRYAISTVPLLRAYCEIDRLLVIDWIDGELLTQYSLVDINQAIKFIQTMAELSLLPEAKELPQAAEACLSLTTIIEQILRRFQRLLTHSQNEPALASFLLNDFMPTFEKYQAQAIDRYQRNSMQPNTMLPFAQRSLIPADFGFHNMIRDNFAQIHFFDFDYFGWDDPVKLLSDILWHPKMQLSSIQKKQFIDGLTTIYRLDPFFRMRFHYNVPLFGLRWILILLNEFIPEFWQNRQHANRLINQAEAKAKQLQRAEALLFDVQQQTGCVYDGILSASLSN